MEPESLQGFASEYHGTLAAAAKKDYFSIGALQKFCHRSIEPECLLLHVKLKDFYKYSPQKRYVKHEPTPAIL